MGEIGVDKMGVGEMGPNRHANSTATTHPCTHTTVSYSGVVFTHNHIAVACHHARYIQCEYTACMHIPVSPDRGIKPMETTQFYILVSSTLF